VEETYSTRNGAKTEAQIDEELRGAGYEGPWELEAALAAYERAAPSPASGVTIAPTPGPATLPDGASGRLSACLNSNLPLPDPSAYINWPTGTDARSRGLREGFQGRVFALGLFASAGMFDNDPMNVRDAFAAIQQSDLFSFHGVTSNQALNHLNMALKQAHALSDAELSANCGLTIIRRSLRAQPEMAGTLAFYGVYSSMGGGQLSVIQSRINSTIQQYRWGLLDIAYPEDLLAYLGTVGAR
jgi:hypothetical protein